MEKKTYLNFEDIRLLTRSCGLYQASVLKERFSSVMEERSLQHYELDYIIDGTAHLVIDDISYTFEKNSVCFRKPGQYCSEMLDSPYSCYAFYFNIIKRDTGELINFSDQYTCFLNNIPTYIPPEQTEGFYSNMVNLSSCRISPKEISKIDEEILILQLIKKLFLIDKKNSKPSQMHPAIRKAISYIDLNITSPITTEELAKHVNLSPTYFHNIFKEYMGITPLEYITTLRLNFAKKHLLETNESIADIAYMHGFSSLSYFSYIFKKNTGVSPVQFRKNVSSDS